MYYPAPAGNDPTNLRDAIVDSLGAEFPAILDTAQKWPPIQASRTENFDRFVTDKALKGVINWMRTIGNDAETLPAVKSFLENLAESLETELKERGLT